MFASLHGAACLAAVWMRICMHVCMSGQYKRGGGGGRRVFICCSQICVWMIKTIDNNNNGLPRHRFTFMCAQKSIVYLVHAMQTRTQGWLRWRIFKIKVFLPPYAVLCVLCLLASNGSLTSCVSPETLKKQPFLFPCAPPNTEALLFMLMALWKKSCWWTRCCCTNLGGFGIDSVLCLVHLRLSSSAFMPICVSRKHMIYLGSFFLLKA